MKMLLWKEWREHRMIFFLSLAGVVITRILLILQPREVFQEEGLQDVVIFTLLTLLFSLLLGAAPFTNEFYRRTLNFLVCQPVTKVRIYWIKYLFGLFLLIFLILFTSLVFPGLKFIYLFGNTFIHLKYFPFIVIVIYSATFFTSLMLKNSLVTVITTPFVIAIGFFAIFLPLLPIVLWKPMQLFEECIPVIFAGRIPVIIVIDGLTIFFLSVLLGFLCWHRGISKSRNPLKIAGHAIPALIFIYLAVAVGLLYIFMFWLMICNLKVQSKEQNIIIFSLILSLFFILMGFLYCKNIISGARYPAKILYISLVLTVSLFLVTHTIANLFAGMELKIARADVKKTGLPLSIEEIIPPPVPDSDNAALLYKEIFLIHEELKEKYSEELKSFSSHLFYTKRDTNELSSEEKRKIYELVFNDPNFLKMYELLKKVVEIPFCRFDIKYEKDKPMELSHLFKMRGIAIMIAVKTFLLTEQGRYGEAMESARIGFRISNAIAYEPFLVSQLVRITCDNITILGLTEMISNIPSDAIPIDVYRRLIEEIELKKGNAGFEKALEGEIAVGGDIFRRILNGKTHAGEMFSESFAGSPEIRKRFLWRVYRSYIGRPLVKKDAAFYLHYMTKMIDHCISPYYEVKNRITEIEKEIGKKLDTRIHLLSSMILPALGSFYVRQAEITAKFDGLEIALALKIYKSKNGEYPSSLDVLIPEYLPELSKDPFTGQNYIYHREGEGFIVYSVGRDERDDNGLYDERGFQRPHDDLAWRCLR